MGHSHIPGGGCGVGLVSDRGGCAWLVHALHLRSVSLEYLCVVCMVGGDWVYWFGFHSTWGIWEREHTSRLEIGMST